MNLPITDAIKARQGHISYHTPAHGGVISNFDITELSYSDNLLSPTGVIATSQKIASEIYGADGTIYVTTGATTAVAIAICALRGSVFLTLGSCHKSVFNAVRTYAKRAYYLYDQGDLANALKATSATAVVVTSPDYFGKCLNLERIAEICKSAGAYLIVDASHGSHFVFSDNLPVSATKYGDLVIHSVHKTLPVLTGGAMLHYKKSLEEKVLLAQNSIHSTSPSYLIMSSIEQAVCRYASEGKAVYDKVLSGISEFKKELVGTEFSIAKSDDMTRVVVTSKYLGNALQDALERAEIFPECSIDCRVVFIVSEMNVGHLPQVAKAFKDIASGALPKYEEPHCKHTREGLIELDWAFGDVELVSPERAVGRRVAMPFGIYPPGVPSALFGEVVEPWHIEEIKNNSNNYFGLVNDSVCVVK